MERDDEASLEDLRLLLRTEGKSRLLINFHVMPRDICYYFYSTRSRSKCGQHPVGQQSVSGRSIDDHPMSFSFFYEKYRTCME